MFKLVDEYMGIRLGAALSALSRGSVTVIESPRRLTAEQSYGYIHGLWWVWLTDGRSAVSVPPGTGAAISEIVREVRSDEPLFDDAMAGRLKAPVDAALEAAGLPHTDRVLFDLVFACNAALLRLHPLDGCRRLTDESVPAAEGVRLPAHCFPDGVAYGVVRAGRVVSVAYAHRAGVMEGAVADVGVETAGEHRRRGYAKAAVSALVADFTRRGGEARYACSPGNVGSVATARSVGFVPYARSVILSAPRGLVQRQL